MWRFASAQVAGTAHTQRAIKCQDRCVCRTLGNGGIVAALADGSGSAEFSDIGAQIAVDTIADVIDTAPIDATTNFLELLRSSVIKARDAVLEYAKNDGNESRQFASTLLAVVSTEYGGGAVQLGDGVIVVGHEAGEMAWVFWPQRGEYANSTRFLTDEDAVDQMEVEAYRNRSLSDLVLISDGLQPLAIHYATRSIHAPFYNGLMGPLLESDCTGHDERLSKALESFLSSPAITGRADDDVSIILATCRPRPESP
jgi:serine/threonine protein phosphatase PrpC